MYKIGFVDLGVCHGLQKAFLDSGHILNLFWEHNRTATYIKNESLLKDDPILQNTNVKIYNFDLEGLFRDSDFVFFNLDKSS